jgi:hypothetical protein
MAGGSNGRICWPYGQQGTGIKCVHYSLYAKTSHYSTHTKTTSKAQHTISRNQYPWHQTTQILRSTAPMTLLCHILPKLVGQVCHHAPMKYIFSSDILIVFSYNFLPGLTPKLNQTLQKLTRDLKQHEFMQGSKLQVTQMTDIRHNMSMYDA